MKKFIPLTLAIAAAGSALAGMPAGLAQAAAVEPPGALSLVIQKVDAADGKLIGSTVTGGHAVAVGAGFTGASCVRGAADLNLSCELLDNYGWFRDQLPHNGTTGGYFYQEIPITTSPVTDDPTQSTHLVTVAETSAPTGYAAIAGTAQIHMSGDGWVADDLPAGVTFTQTNGYYYLTFADHKLQSVVACPATTTTRTVTTKVPVTTTTTTNPSVLVQVDAYTARTTTQARSIARLDDDNTLGYREDGPLSPLGSAGSLWGSSRSKIVTVSAAQIKQYGSAQAAAARIAGLGTPTLDVRSTPKVGQTVVKAWVLAKDATAALPWGPGKNLAQRDIDATGVLPVARTTSVTTYKNVVTTQVVTVPASTTTMDSDLAAAWVAKGCTVTPVAP